MSYYYPPRGRLLLGAVLIALVVGAPYARPPLTLYWTGIVLVAAYFLLRWFLRCGVTAEAVTGRDPATLKRVSLPMHEVREATNETLGVLSIPGFVLCSEDRKRVFLCDSARRDQRIPEVTPQVSHTEA